MSDRYVRRIQFKTSAPHKRAAGIRVSERPPVSKLAPSKPALTDACYLVVYSPNEPLLRSLLIAETDLFHDSYVGTL